jgi:hypothetical protein
VPIAGGLAKMPPRAREIGAEAAQIFTRNQLQWRAEPIRDEEAAAFKDAISLHPLRRLVAHGSYLVNLASPDPVGLSRSREAFLADMRRCHALGVTHLIFHAGAHLGAGEDAGLTTVARSLDWLLERSEGLAVRPVIEVTAGQGSCLAHRFEHLARIFERTRGRERVGVCLDTCHLWAARARHPEPGRVPTHVRGVRAAGGPREAGRVPLQRRQAAARQPARPPRADRQGLLGPRDVPAPGARRALPRRADDPGDARGDEGLGRGESGCCARSRSPRRRP